MKQNNTLPSECKCKKLTCFPISSISVTDNFCKNSFDKEIEYLKTLKPDKLLAGFCETKGIPAKAEKYGGWECTEIRGHTIGHYLVAMSQLYEATTDKEVLLTIKYVIDELKKCQFDSGYLSAFPENYFDCVENKKPIWAPWYTMHKIISGLIAAYKATDSKTAYSVVTKLGDWVFDRTARWTDEIQATVLVVEYGGMNDCLYDLYKITGNDNYIKSANKFEESSLISAVCDGNDILSGKHANTTIPKFLGALNRYLVLGKSESSYFQACENFWNMVVNNHSYTTGGNSEAEHFGDAGVLDANRTNCTCETCNSHNMLKLSKRLFEITGDKKYADYYENTFFNSIQTSQNPQTGMTTYFQPMATGYFKIYGKPSDDFWCCTGTGMENFTKLGDGIYFHDMDSIYVNQYISSILTWSEKNIKLTQTTDIPNTEKALFIVNTSDNQDTSVILKFRIPDWSFSEISVTVNQKPYEAVIENGYIVINKLWADGDTVELDIPVQIYFSTLPDEQTAVAFRYGPIALSAGLGKEDMAVSSTGISVTIPTKSMEFKEFIKVKNGTVQQWLSDLKNNLVKNDDKLEFTLKNTDEDDHLIFIPHYKQYQERYGIYWYIADDNFNALQEKEHKATETVVDKQQIN